MGMFDNMEIEIKCPYCGRIIDGFQTKSGGCFLHIYKPGDKISSRDSYDGNCILTGFNCYSWCNHGYKIGESGKYLTLIKQVECDVWIPVIDNIISPDRSTWKIKFEYKEGSFYNTVPFRKITKEWVDDFNNRIIDAEYECLWNNLMEKL